MNPKTIEILNKFYAFLIPFILITTTAALAQTPQTVRYEYDALNRLTRATYPNSVTVTYNYDVLGNRTSVVVSQPSTGQPDLTVTNPTISPALVGVGGSVQASCTVSNLQTTATSSAFRVRFYLSVDNQFDGSDMEVGTAQTLNAPFTGEQTVSTQITLPATVSGNRFILFYVDADNQVTNEVSESNNVVVSAITITTTNPCPNITVSLNTSPTTQGGGGGSASANASGGQSPYSYAWSNGGSGQSIIGLAAGTYSVTATDANGCKGVGSGTVSTSGSSAGSCWVGTVVNGYANQDPELAIGFDKIYFVHNPGTGSQIGSLTIPGHVFDNITYTHPSNPTWVPSVRNLSFANGKLAAVITYSGETHYVLFDVFTKNIENRLVVYQNKTYNKIILFGSKLYCQSYSQTIDVWDLTTNSSGSIPLPAGVYHMDIDPGTGNAYVGDFNNNLLTISLTTNAIENTLAVGGSPYMVKRVSNKLCVAYDPPGNSLYYLKIFDATTYASLGEIEIRNPAVGGDMTVKGSSTLFVPSAADKTIQIIDLNSLAMLNEVVFPQAVTNLAYDAVSDRVYTGGNGTTTYLSNGSGSFTATLSGSQTITSGKTATLTATITGSGPWSLTLSNGQIYNAATSPFAFTVSPTTTTTYTLTRVSNVCGTGSISGSAVITLTSSGSCTSMYSVKTGNWNDPTVWSCNRIPTGSDVVQVSTGHIVTIPASVTASARRLQDSGRVVFGVGAKLMLAVSSPPSSTTTSPPTADITTGLLAYYPFDGNVGDASGNNRNGTPNGGLAYTTDRTGSTNKAANFDGVDDWIDTPYTQSNLTEFTVSVWVKTDLGIIPSGVNPSAIMQNRNTPGGSGLTLDYDRSDGAWEFGLDGSGTKIVKRMIYPNPNVWRHIAAVWKGSGQAIGSAQFTIYINGVLQSSKTTDVGSGSIPFTSAGSLKIGYHQPWNTYFRGSLDELRIYNRALSETEIQALANQ